MSAVAELTSRQELVLDGLNDYYIDSGGHGTEAFNEKTACIMEAFCLVLGYDPHNLPDGDHVYLTPPCVSEEIATFFIEINDAIFDDDVRAKLKPLAVMILNTAPTYKKGKKTFKKKSSRDYKRAEKQRESLLYEFFGTSKEKLGWSVPSPELRRLILTESGNLRYAKLKKFIQQLVDVGKFENGELVENV